MNYGITLIILGALMFPVGLLLWLFGNRLGIGILAFSVLFLIMGFREKY